MEPFSCRVLLERSSNRGMGLTLKAYCPLQVGWWLSRSQFWLAQVGRSMSLGGVLTIQSSLCYSLITEV